MRTFTYVLAQMYEKNGLSIPTEKASDHVLDEFEIDTTVYDKEELQRERDELRPTVKKLENEYNQLLKQLKELRSQR